MALEGNLLYKFLKRECCLREYIDNIIAFSNKTTDIENIEVIDFLKINNSISSAFVWQNTKQGHGYWEKISSKWVKYQTDFINKNRKIS